VIGGAAEGRFPAPDGGWHRVPPWRPGLEAVVSFTAHAVFAVAPDITDDRLAALGADGFGGAHDPRLITALAGPDGWMDVLDMLMAGRGTGRAGERRDQPRVVGATETVRAERREPVVGDVRRHGEHGVGGE